MDLTEEFRNYLKRLGFSSNTVKNYVSDLSTYVDYLKNDNQYFSVLTLAFLFTDQKLVSYRSWLAHSFPLLTANRKLSALRKFIKFCISRQLVEKSYVGTIANLTTTNVFTNTYISNDLINDLNSPEKTEYSVSKAHGSGQPIGHKDLDRFRKYLINQGNSTNTVKGYVSDVKQYLGLRTSSAQSDASSTRRLYSLKKFIYWNRLRNGVVSPTPKEEGQSIVPKRSAIQAPKARMNIRRLSLFSLGVSLLVCLLAVTKYTASIDFARFRSLQRLDFLGSIFAPTPFLIDPTSHSSIIASSPYKSNHTVTKILGTSIERTLNLFQLKLIDPTEVNTN